MKKTALAALLAVVLLLSGCGSFLNREYSTVQPHTSGYYETDDRSTLRAESYQDLVNDLLLLIGSQKAEGVIWLYPGSDETPDAAEAAERACQEVKQETPMGAYAVDYITYNVDDSARNYSQISLTLRYRRTAEQVAAIVHATSVDALYDLLIHAARAGADELVIQVGYFDHQEEQVAETVERVQQETSRDAEAPWAVNYYPAQGNPGIIEILLGEND